jgi:poly(hydroxyalkanoate) granule-associated protein
MADPEDKTTTEKEKSGETVPQIPPAPQTPPLSPEEENWQQQFKKVFLAGLGAVALAEEEIEKFVHKLVEKGTLAENEGRKWLKEVAEKYKQTKDKVHSIETSLEKTSMGNLEYLLSKLNIPSKNQFEDLTKKVDELRARIDELSKKLPS